MQLTHILKAALVVICCAIVYAFGIVIIFVGLFILAIYVVALMMQETEKEEEN